jgi:molybdate transport system substrate-binding protein
MNILRRIFLLSLCAALIGTAPAAVAADSRRESRPEILVFAAASLTNVLGELSAAWSATSGVTVRTSFAASSVLARQIEAGGRADAFISADEEWMDYLQSRHLIDNPTRRNLVGNRLVLVAPADSKLQVKIVSGFDLAGTLGNRRLATGDPDTVPAGRYARSALVSLGIWDEIQDRLVRADNVRSAMTFVALGEVPLGIVYATDARVDPRVRIVDIFPEHSHPSITYPGAATQGARSAAKEFLEFLTSAPARDIWVKSGFLELKK